MTADEKLPSIAELLKALQEQQARVTQLELKAREVDELKAELERQRAEKLSLQSEVSELKRNTESGGRRVSRAGLLKAAAAGAAGLIGVEMFGEPGTAQAGMVTPGNTYDGDVILGGLNPISSETIISAQNGNNGWTGEAVLFCGPNGAGTGPSATNPTANIVGIYAIGNGIAPGVLAVGGSSNSNVAYGNGVVGLAGDHGPTNLHDVGVLGASTNGPGVFGESYHSHGVKGVVNAGSGTVAGLYGVDGSGVGCGVIGKTVTDANESVLGNGTGVQGISGGGTGVEGMSTAGAGGSFGGGRAAIRLEPGDTAGAPSIGVHMLGDVVIDSSGILYQCVEAGTPGAWVPFVHGNSNDGTNDTLFTRVSTRQYTLSNSDGVTWVDMDGTNLSLTITPRQNSLAIITGNSDLWTSSAGYNQDIGVFLSGGGYGLGTVVAWKESGGFAGTFSPNAAFVQTVRGLGGGNAYTIKLQWKTNKNAPGATIWAGAGPIGGEFSPTSLTVLLIPAP